MSGVLFALLLSSLFHGLRKQLTHSLYNERPVLEDIVIIAMDDKTLSSSEGLGNRKNWSRAYYADVIQAALDGGAQSVFVDIIFTENSQSIPKADLAEAIVSASSVEELTENLAPFAETLQPQDLALQNALNKDVFLLKYSDSQGRVVQSYAPFVERAQGAFSEGSVKDNEQAVYSVSSGRVVNGVFEQSLPYLLAERYLGTELPEQDEELIINYAGKVGAYKRLSFVDVYHGEIEPSFFEDKIVMIGGTASILQDLHFTPIDPGVPMPGVEIQANATQTLIDGALLSEASPLAMTLALAPLLFILSLLFLSLPLPAGLTALIGFEVALYVLAKSQFGAGVIWDLLFPPSLLLLTGFAALVYRNLTELWSRRELKRAFAHYLSPQLVNEIAKQPDLLALGGKKQDLTVMFLDFKDFTTLSEQRDPKEVVEILNSYFDAFAKVIFEFGGMVDKFEGDGLMALFGAPIEDGAHLSHAVWAGMKIQETLEVLNAESGLNLQARIGISSGPATVGNMGSSQRFDYTAIGDTVNTAARLEAAGKHYGVPMLIAGGVEGLSEEFALRMVDRVRLKGKKEAVDVYMVQARAEDVTEQLKLALSNWHSALDYLRNKDYTGCEAKLNEAETGLVSAEGSGDVLVGLYKERVAWLKANPNYAFDGVWEW